MKAVVATGLFGAVAIAVLTEIMSVVMTLSAMHHVASYNSWMTM
ncbi:MAG: hypothetical protein ACR652_12680 [Methylocystis sp.]